MQYVFSEIIPLDLGSHNLTCLSDDPETISLDKGEYEMPRNALEPFCN